MSIYLGNTEIGQIYLGNTEIAEAYLGSTKVFDGGGSILPEGYTQVEHITSPHGKTPYILAGVNAGNSLEFELKYSDPLTFTGQYGGAILGGRNYSGNNDFQLTNYNGGMLRTGGSSSPSFSITANMVNECSLHGNTFIWNGSSYTVTRSMTVGIPIWIFGLNQLTGSAANQFSDGTLYYLKLWSGGNLVRDFIPCLKEDGNEYGLFDLVGRTFYGSSNSDKFTL